MNLVDSSGWLEYFADGSNAQFYLPALENIKDLIVPTICIYEVFKRILQQRDEDNACRAVTLMQGGHIIPLDMTLSIKAAQMSQELKLHMADSIILATARQHNAIIWTQDDHFKNLPGVKFFKK